MFRATISDVSLLKDSLGCVAEIVDEAVFKISKEGISLKAADRAMVAAVSLNLSAEAFDSFEVDQETNIGVNLENLLSILKRASARDRISLELKDSKLEILLQNSSRRRFTIPLLELSVEEIPQVEQLEFAARANLDSNTFSSGIEDAEIVADSVLFEASPSTFGMRADGDVSTTELQLEKGEAGLLDLKANERLKARYPLDYLKKMIKGTKLSDTLTLEFGQDYPLKLTFRAGDKCTLSFVLAPRVSEE